MAGISVRLRQLSHGDNLLAPVASIGHAAVIACGPWIFTVIALALIGSITGQRLPLEDIEGFRLIVIYAFSVSLVAATPVVMAATRLVGDAIYLHAYHRIAPLFVAALIVGSIASMILAFLVLALLFRIPAPLVVAGTSSSGVVAMIWVGLAFCGAVRDYQGITIGFVAGLFVAVLCSVWAALSSAGIAGMVWGFEAGLLLVFCGLAGRVLITFPQPVEAILEPIRVLWLGMRHFWLLTVGGLVSAVAIWLDKWLIWIGPTGETHTSGLIHAPLYDSAMFTAYLAIIPALSLFVTHVETVFLGAYNDFYDAIRNHGTLRQIEEKATTLEETTVQYLTHIVVIQAALCAIVAVTAPSIVEAIGLRYQQVGILRLGVLGALFQFTFLASSSLLLFFDRHAEFLGLQCLFLVFQAVLTTVTVQLGTMYYGLGNLVACVVCGLLAFAVLGRTARNLTSITFRSGSSPGGGTLAEALSTWDQGGAHSIREGEKS